MNSLLLVVAVLFQFGFIAECALPRLPTSLSGSPNYNKYISTENDRIVGGTVAPKNKFPYQVSLQKKSDTKAKHFCGACIISDRYILTAAHCTSNGEAKNIQALVGTNNLYDGSGTSYKVQSCQRNPKYNSSTVYGDMSLCKTQEPIQFSEAVQPIPIAEYTDELKAPEDFVVSGWGTTTEGGSLSSSLMEVEVPFITDADCEEAYGEGEINKHMICAGKAGKDSCQGDSGGPMVKYVDGEAVLVGIVSWGYGCARPQFPGVYTEISYFREYVMDNCNKDPDNKRPVSAHALA